MAARYWVIVRDSSGTKVDIIQTAGLSSLSYSKQRNNIGECNISLYDISKASNFTLNQTFIEVWRENTHPDYQLSAYCDFYGLVLADDYTYNDSGERYSIRAKSMEVLLQDRIVAYREGSPLRSSFSSQKTETIMNTLVKYNATASGTTTDGRRRLATIPHMTVETNQSRGNTVTLWECANENLLSTLQNLGKQEKAGFEIVRSGTDLLWRYVVGNDLTSELIFSKERGNVNSIKRTRDRSQEKTVAIIGGKGEGVTQLFELRTGPNYDVSTNNKEMYVNASSEDLSSEMLARADEQFAQVRYKPQFDFEPRQTPSAYYGKHYQLHDLVSCRAMGETIQLRVDEITVAFEDGKENITVRLADT